MESMPHEDEELHAFIDGELDGEAMLRFQRRMAASPELAVRVDRFRDDKALIASVYGPLIDVPLPDSLVGAAKRPASRPARPIRSYLLAGMAAAIVAVLWIWAPHGGGMPTDRLVAEAVAIKTGLVRPERIVTAAIVASRTSRDRLVAETLALPIKVPDLTPAGYRLSGIDIYPDQSARHALQLRYRDRGGRVFSLYLRHPVGPDRFDLLRRGSTQICVWQNEDLGVVMAGEMSPTDMLKVATLTYADLNF